MEFWGSGRASCCLSGGRWVYPWGHHSIIPHVTIKSVVLNIELLLITRIFPRNSLRVLYRTMNIFFPGYLSRYHDNEWGVPVVADDRLMFEMISLEGAQAGLSWATILAKRSGYKK